MNPENQFLASQQARLHAIEKKSSQRSENADAIHSFWERLRSNLFQWEASVEQLCKEKKDEASDDKRQEAASTTTTANHPNSNQLLLDLKLELQQLQKHCLGSVVVFEDWEVPILPVADLRLLHNVFSKHLSQWEKAQQEIAPKGKFVFRRYREEVARRNIAPQQTITQPDMDATLKPSSLATTSGENTSSAAASGIEGALLQDLNEASIVIATDGSVRIGDQQISLTITEAALLVRNLKQCSLTIYMKLMTLHIVDSVDTNIILQEPVGSAIHVTGCHSCQLQASGQQLRLHDSTDLYCQVNIGAGAILEDCSGIVFVTTTASESIDVRDFNWLRSGEPSPNYEIRKDKTADIPKEDEEGPRGKETQDSASLTGEAAEPSKVSSGPETNVVVEAPQKATPALGTIQPTEEDSDDDDDDEL